PLVDILLLAVLTRAAPEAPRPHDHRHIVSAVQKRPFVGEYLCISDKIGTIRVEDTPKDYITFYTASNDSLPKPSYGCGFIPHPGLSDWRFDLQDACEALIMDSGGYYDQKFLMGIRAIVP
ncbi:hypothetical protein FOZ63_017404, partial [Perkinsus olseni]